MEVAVGVGSLVLLAGGVTAAARRTIRPGQALGVLGVAAGVAVIALVTVALGHGRSFSGLYQFAVIAPTTVAGIAMAVALVQRPARRIR
jgi:hypothetical protein